MKAEIEGERGSKLRQTATEAVKIDVAVHDRGVRRQCLGRMPISSSPSAMPSSIRHRQDVRFEGFLGPQATNLFEMTRVK